MPPTAPCCQRRLEPQPGKRWCAGRVKAQLAACGLSAAWRMGRWDAVDTYLQHMQAGASPGPKEAVKLDADERWEGRLGRLLSDVHHRYVLGAEQ